MLDVEDERKVQQREVKCKGLARNQDGMRMLGQILLKKEKKNTV